MPEADGYIKFTVAHQSAPPPIHPWLHNLMRLRDELVDWKLIGILPDGIGYGNLSARIGDSQRFVITASGTGREYPIAARHFCEVVSFDIAKNAVQCRGPQPASSESMSHGAVYAARPDARVVIHIHDRPLFRMLQHEGTPQTPPGATFGTPEIALAIRALAATLPPVALLVMAGHEDGLIAFAPDLRAARDALETAYSRSRHY